MSPARPSRNSCRKDTNQIQVTPFLNLVYLSSRNMNNHKGSRTWMKTRSLDPAFSLLIGCEKVLFNRSGHVDHSRIQRLFNKARQPWRPACLLFYIITIIHNLVSICYLGLCVSPCACVSVFLHSRTRMPMCVFIWELGLGSAWWTCSLRKWFETAGSIALLLSPSTHHLLLSGLSTYVLPLRVWWLHVERAHERMEGGAWLN